MKIKPLKVTKGREILPQLAKPLEINPVKTGKGYNPIVTLKLDNKVYFGIDLWTLVMVYAPNKALIHWTNLNIFLDDKEVRRD